MNALTLMREIAYAIVTGLDGRNDKSISSLLVVVVVTF
jgi:hypothetical protein